MPIKFEWQFKHRDERFLNTAAMKAPFRDQKPSIHAGFLHFRGFRFTLPVGDAVTIAETGAIPAARMERSVIGGRRICGRSGSGLRGVYHRARASRDPLAPSGLRRADYQNEKHHRRGSTAPAEQDEGVGNTSGSYLPASCRRLRINDPPFEERRSLHDRHL